MDRELQFAPERSRLRFSKTKRELANFVAAFNIRPVWKASFKDFEFRIIGDLRTPFLIFERETRLPLSRPASLAGMDRENQAS
jgi:hypothetical protein